MSLEGRRRMTGRGRRQRDDVGRRFFGLREPDPRKTGIVINEAKRSMLGLAPVKAPARPGSEDFQAYRDLLDSRAGAAEHGAFISAITTNVTSFFREPGHFEALANMVPGIAARAEAGNASGSGPPDVPRARSPTASP
jgi:hypothetical protein